MVAMPAPTWTWLNEPGDGRDRGSVPTDTTGHGSDGWNVTRCGFVRDHGKFAVREQTGDFDPGVAVAGEDRQRSDQMALMVRFDDATRLKTGIEFLDGVPYASARVTYGLSDWSVSPLPDTPAMVRVRPSRRDAAIRVHDAGDRPETLRRLTYRSAAPTSRVGPVGASGTARALRRSPATSSSPPSRPRHPNPARTADG